MANFLSNTSTPKNNALDKVAGKLKGLYPQLKNPLTDQNTKFRNNPSLSLSVGNVPKPATNPVAKPVQSKPVSNTPTASYPSSNPSVNPSPVAPTTPSPSGYARTQENLISRIQGLSDKYTPRVAAPYAETGIGEGQKRLSDYELARYNAELTGTGRAADLNQSLLTTSLPKEVSPGSSLINPITQNQIPGYSPEASAFRGGQINQRAIQGAQSVQFDQAQNTISTIKGLLGGDNATSINRLNQFINDVRGNVSSPELASFKSYLGSLAQQVTPYNQALATELTNYAGTGLGTANGNTIMAAINSAQQALQGQQQAITGGGQSSGGSVINTTVGPINTNW